jgi:hypothetical protein
LRREDAHSPLQQFLPNGQWFQNGVH